MRFAENNLELGTITILVFFYGVKLKLLISRVVKVFDNISERY
jgi:hypothetical protein